MVGAATARVLAEECRRLREVDVDVRTILPSELETEVFGFDLINLKKVAPAIEAGKRRGEREAGQLKGWWANRRED